MLEKLVPEKYHYDIYRFKQKLLGREHHKSYSQEGEDMLLNRLFEHVKNGFFVDVGAHHPVRFSNTYFFYKKGWRGINIDAMPGSMKKFNAKRKEDINLEVAISRTPQKLIYYSFEEPALNGFDSEISEQRIVTGSKLKAKIEINTNTLAAILDRHLNGKRIDFLSIDVEGLDFEILQSNNWEKYKPQVILIECLHKDFEQLVQDEVFLFLKNQGYSLIAKTINTCFFKLN